MGASRKRGVGGIPSWRAGGTLSSWLSTPLELFRLSEGWLRQDLVPALPDNVRLVLAGREPPASAWWTTPGWQGLFRYISLPRSERTKPKSWQSGWGSPKKPLIGSTGWCGAIHWV